MKHIIYVTVEGGLVTDIENIPDGIEVHVIDKDVEGENQQNLSISPIDGDACCISEFHSYESRTPSGAA